MVTLREIGLRAVQRADESDGVIDSGLAGKVVLVTGANRGIGAATVLAFAAQGAKVAIHYLGVPQTPPVGVTFEHTAAGDDGRAAALARQAVEAGAPAAVDVRADLSDPDALPRLVDEVTAHLGLIDVLVNNAAHAESPDGVADLDVARMARTYAVNVFAPSSLVAELVRRRGSEGAPHFVVVTISTDAAQAFVGQVAYGTSKAAMEAFTRAGAIELGQLGIRVNTVAPGPVQTGWMSDELVARVVGDIPMRRVGEPADIADAVVFLASDQAQWITGQVLQVAGGHAL